MLDRFIPDPIQFVEKGRINLDNLKKEIDRRILKVSALCFLDTNKKPLEPIIKMDSLAQTQEIELPKPIQNMISGLFLPEENLKNALNSDRPTENLDSKRSCSSDDDRKEIEKSGDSKFFNESNLEFEKLIYNSKLSDSLQSQCMESSGNFLHDISMKSSFRQESFEISDLTPIKEFAKDSSVKKSSIGSSKLLNCTKKSVIVTSFIEGELHLKRQPLSSFNKDMKKSFCDVCMSKASFKTTKTERKEFERISISQPCKDRIAQSVSHLAKKNRRENNQNKMRGNLLKRIAERSQIAINERKQKLRD